MKFETLLKREIYRKYSHGIKTGAIGVGSIGWFVGVFILIVFIASLTNEFHSRNDVQPSEISEKTELLVNQWKSYDNNEIPIYELMVTETYDGEPDSAMIYRKTIKVDSTSLKKLIGIATNKPIEVGSYSYIPFKKTGNLTVGKPNNENIHIVTGAITGQYLWISDIMLSDTKTPESRTFIYLIALLLALYSPIRFLSAAFKIFKKSVPIYGKVPIYKADKRYRYGQKVDGHTYKKVGTEKMTPEELASHRKQQGINLLIFLLLASASIGTLYYLHLS